MLLYIFFSLAKQSSHGGVFWKAAGHNSLMSKNFHNLSLVQNLNQLPAVA